MFHSSFQYFTGWQSGIAGLWNRKHPILENLTLVVLLKKQVSLLYQVESPPAFKYFAYDIP